MECLHSCFNQVPFWLITFLVLVTVSWSSILVPFPLTWWFRSTLSSAIFHCVRSSLLSVEDRRLFHRHCSLLRAKEARRWITPTCVILSDDCNEIGLRWNRFLSCSATELWNINVRWQWNRTEEIERWVGRSGRASVQATLRDLREHPPSRYSMIEREIETWLLDWYLLEIQHRSKYESLTTDWIEQELHIAHVKSGSFNMRPGGKFAIFHGSVWSFTSCNRKCSGVILLSYSTIPFSLCIFFPSPPHSV